MDRRSSFLFLDLLLDFRNLDLFLEQTNNIRYVIMYDNIFCLCLRTFHLNYLALIFNLLRNIRSKIKYFIYINLKCFYFLTRMVFKFYSNYMEHIFYIWANKIEIVNPCKSSLAYINYFPHLYDKKPLPRMRCQKSPFFG